MSILPKAIYRYNKILIKLPMVFFTELEQIISQFVWKYKKPRISKAIKNREWRRRMELEESTCLTQALLQSHSHQDSRYWHKDRNIDQWNKIENPEINPCTYGHLIFNPF